MVYFKRDARLEMIFLLSAMVERERAWAGVDFRVRQQHQVDCAGHDKYRMSIHELEEPKDAEFDTLTSFRFSLSR